MRVYNFLSKNLISFLSKNLIRFSYFLISFLVFSFCFLLSTFHLSLFFFLPKLKDGLAAAAKGMETESDEEEEVPKPIF